jgi:transcriptional regulator with XRE-family HTH domain
MARGRKTEWDQSAHDFMTAIGQKLRDRRRYLGMSTRSLGSKVGLSHVQISNIERAESDFSVSYLYNFAAALDISPAELMPDPLDIGQGNGHAAAVVEDAKAKPAPT